MVATIIWQMQQHNKTNNTIINYHTESIRYVSTIIDEIRVIQIQFYNYYISKTNKSHSDIKPNIRHTVLQSIHLIKRNLKNVSVVQNKFGHSDFNIKVSQLQSLFKPIFDASNKNSLTFNLTILFDVDRIKTIILTSQQLKRLHEIAKVDLVLKNEIGLEYHLKILIIFILVIALVIGYLINRVFRAIKEIIEDQKSSTKKLYQEKELTHTTLISIGDAVITTRSDGSITTLNPVAEKLTGWKNSEAQGKSVKQVFSIVDASTREVIDNPIDKVIETGKTVYLSNHTTLIARDGKEHQIADSAAPIIDKGKILGMVLVFNDVTEQYQLRQAAAKSERDLQAIMDHLPAIIYIKNTDGQFIYVNHQFETLFKITNHEIKGKSVFDIFPSDSADAMQKNDESILSTGKSIELEETVIVNNILHTYVSIKFPLFDDDNNIYATCGISTDISKRKQQDEQLRKSQKMDAIGKLTGGVAHDYNNMLGVILGYAELLNNSLDSDPKLSKYSHEIIRSAEHGAALTKKLLSFSQVKPNESRPIDINILLRERRLMLEKVLTSRITLNYDLEDPLSAVELNFGDLEDALVNICINAMHAMPDGGNISIRTSNVKLDSEDVEAMRLTPGNYIELKITDTGCGMDADTKEKIFDPFFSTKGDKGTGLGLSQVYGFIQRSDGAIKVYSEVNHGTSFVLFFPKSSHSLTETKIQKTDSKISLRGNENILVVDDEKALADLALEVLSKQGYKVSTATNGEQALNFIKNNPVDLVLSDVIMPNMDGYELATKVRKHYPELKVQLVSGFDDDRHINISDESLRKNILPKPYTSKSLLTRVRSLLDGDYEA